MKVLESQEQVLTLSKISLKVNGLMFIFSNVANFGLQCILRYIFKTTTLRALISKKHVVPTEMVLLKGRGF